MGELLLRVATPALMAPVRETLGQIDAQDALGLSRRDTWGAG